MDTFFILTVALLLLSFNNILSLRHSIFATKKNLTPLKGSAKLNFYITQIINLIMCICCLIYVFITRTLFLFDLITLLFITPYFIRVYFGVIAQNMYIPHYQSILSAIRSVTHPKQFNEVFAGKDAMTEGLLQLCAGIIILVLYIYFRFISISLK